MPVSPQTTRSAAATRRPMVRTPPWPAWTASSGSPARAATSWARSDLGRAAGHDHPPALGDLGPDHLGEPLGRPAPRRAGRARVDQGGAGGPVGHRAGRQLQVEPARVGGDAALLEQPAPAGHLVLVGPPAGALGAGRHGRVGERHQPPRLGGQQQVVALGAAAVQVHGQPGAVQAPVQRLVQPVGADDLVDRARGPGQRGQHGRGGQQARVAREGVGQGPQGRDRGEQVAQPEGAQHPRRPGAAGAPRAGSGSRPRRLRGRAHHQLPGLAAGRLAEREQDGLGDVLGPVQLGVRAGLYCSGRPSKKAVCMPPGISRVTPTRPAVSAARALVKPTTPNLLAQ